MLCSKWLVVLLIVSVSAQRQCGRKGTSSDLIVGEVQPEINEWPWLASLIDLPTQKFFCGATIISKQVLLTVAHCLHPKYSSKIKSADDVIAYLGKNNVKLELERGVKAFFPSEVLIHPDWDVFSQRYDADIALLKSNILIRFSDKISPVCLWAENSNEIIDGVIAGWGSLDTSQLSQHEIFPRHVKVKRMSIQKCHREFPMFSVISSKRTFCSGGEAENSGPCFGDSGGGFYVLIDNGWFITGIISAAFLDIEGHCDVNRYTLYTKLSDFGHWINETLETVPTQADLLPFQ